MNVSDSRIELKTVSIDGFKSFSNFEIDLQRLTVLIGSNGAGKSNFLEALDLITSVYRSGLDEAVDYFGGYELIARRTRGAVSSEISFSVSALLELPKMPCYGISHSFTFRASDKLGRLSVEREELRVSNSKTGVTLVTLRRNQLGLFAERLPSIADGAGDALIEIEHLVDDLTTRRRSVDTSKLFFPAMAPFSTLISAFSDSLASTRTFEIDAELAREESDKSHRPDLTPYGGQLPSFLEWLREDDPEAFGRVESGLRDMLPSLRSLNVVETQPGVRAVQFDMEQGPSPLYPTSVSDGTIKYLALLAAINDPRSSLLLLEEPENSLHPWLINRLSEAIEAASHDKAIILTSHSPQVMRGLPLNSIYVVWMREGMTHTELLQALAPELVDAWSSGELNVFDVVESGAVTEYLPNYSL